MAESYERTRPVRRDVSTALLHDEAILYTILNNFLAAAGEFFRPPRPKPAPPEGKRWKLSVLHAGEACPSTPLPAPGKQLALSSAGMQRPKADDPEAESGTGPVGDKASHELADSLRKQEFLEKV